MADVVPLLRRGVIYEQKAKLLLINDGVVAKRPAIYPKSTNLLASMSDKNHPRNTISYKSLPYNPELKEYAKSLRKAGNLAEVLFWKEVQKGKFLGLDFDRQKIIGNYIADFYCVNVHVVIEIDGSSHSGKEDYDEKRDEYMESLGLTIIRISDKRVKKEMGAVLEFLKAHDKFKTINR